LRGPGDCGLLANRLKLLSLSKRQRSGSRLVAAIVMLSLWAAVCALEISPRLHRLLHDDAQNPAHNCLVTQFQHHLSLPVFAAAAALTLPELPAILTGCSDDFQFRSPYDYRLSPSRAPPAV
jgi:hypothetical protein